MKTESTALPGLEDFEVATRKSYLEEHPDKKWDGDKTMPDHSESKELEALKNVVIPPTPSSDYQKYYMEDVHAGEAQEKLNSIEVEGVSGGGMVKVLATAKGDVKRIMIDDTLMSKEEKEITEDLIVAAINDAKQKGEAASQEEMKSVTGGIPLPPGMKLPF